MDSKLSPVTLAGCDATNGEVATKEEGVHQMWREDQMILNWEELLY